MATIIGWTEAQRMTCGKASVSYPECLMAECDCEERQVLRASEAVCRSHGPGQGGPHPWEEE